MIGILFFFLCHSLVRIGVRGVDRGISELWFIVKLKPPN